MNPINYPLKLVVVLFEKSVGIAVLKLITRIRFVRTASARVIISEKSNNIVIIDAYSTGRNELEQPFKPGIKGVL